MRLVAQLREGERHIDGLLTTATEQLLQSGLRPDTLVIRDAQTLQPLTVDSRRAVVLFTAWLGNARLIDNAQVDLIS